MLGRHSERKACLYFRSVTESENLPKKRRDEVLSNASRSSCFVGARIIAEDGKRKYVNRRQHVRKPMDNCKSVVRGSVEKYGMVNAEEFGERK